MSKLAAQIEATNLGHKRANELYKELVEVFRPLIGQKIVNADHGLSVKVKKLMPELEYNNSIAIWHSSSRYSISFTIRVSVQVANGGGWESDETTVYIGSLNGDVLGGINEYQEKRCDYTVEEIQQKRQEYKMVKAQLEKIASELFPFSVD